MNRSIKEHKEMLDSGSILTAQAGLAGSAGRGSSLEVSDSKRLISIRRKAESRAWLRGTAAGVAVTCPLIF